MNFCPSCGIQLDAGVRFCPNCGAPISADAQQAQNDYHQQAGYQAYQQSQYRYQQPQATVPSPDVPATGLKLLSFFFPLAGLILFLTAQNDKPVSAKAYGKMALIGFIVSIVFSVLYFVSVFAFAIGNATMDFDVFGYTFEMFAKLI